LHSTTLKTNQLVLKCKLGIWAVKLGYVKFSGYKRFLKPTTLSLSGKMVALIGPNEAGKTSTLKLLKHISNDEAFKADESYKYDENVTPQLEACFFLDKSDHELIGNKAPSKLLIRKTTSGDREFALYPELIRDKKHRLPLLTEVTKVLKNEHVIDFLDNKLGLDLEEYIEKIQKLDLTDRQYDDDELQLFATLLDCLKDEEYDSIKAPAYAKKLPSKIEAFLEKERAEHPNEVALELLKQNIPTVIEFTSEDRKLETSYNMIGYKHAAQQSRTIPCNALKSLSSVAELDLDLLKTHLDNQEPDRIEKQIRNANAKLKQVFDKAWTQSDIKIHLGWDKPLIQIMVEERDAGDFEYITVDKRSDGLRQYIALFAFIIKEDVKTPILLIDEAELHLHYDAQADLIQTLTRKDLASKIVYTTHSAGCLPEDLGSGVKLVIPEKDGDTFSTSKIENKFWNSDNLGFSPILYGMGANTLAFFPTRKAVIVEGQSDPLLLPTIFRQSSGLEFNNFQIVPGMANLSSKNIPMLALQGQRVAYLVDNDDAGDEYIEQLKEAGIQDKYLFKVCSSEPSIVTVEDLIDDKVFSEAIETYLHRFMPEITAITANHFDGTGKAQKMKKFERDNNIKISKVDLAYIILEISEAKADKVIFNKSFKKAINELRKKLAKVLEKE